MMVLLHGKSSESMVEDVVYTCTSADEGEDTRDGCDLNHDLGLPALR